MLANIDLEKKLPNHLAFMSLYKKTISFLTDKKSLIKPLN